MTMMTEHYIDTNFDYYRSSYVDCVLHPLHVTVTTNANLSPIRILEIGISRIVHKCHIKL